MSQIRCLSWCEVQWTRGEIVLIFILLLIFSLCFCVYQRTIDKSCYLCKHNSIKENTPFTWSPNKCIVVTFLFDKVKCQITTSNLWRNNKVRDNNTTLQIAMFDTKLCVKHTLIAITPEQLKKESNLIPPISIFVITRKTVLFIYFLFFCFRSYKAISKLLLN